MTSDEPRYPRQAGAPSSGAYEQLTRLVYELLDAHNDTARIVTGQDRDVRWQAHLNYLRDLQRVARDLLAHAGQREGAEAFAPTDDLLRLASPAPRGACQSLLTPSADRPECARMRTRGDMLGTRDQNSASAEERRRQYVDELIDDYVSWREACASVTASYEKWRCSDRRDKRLAFSVYVAALDREEQAATAYERAVAQVATT
jgi:hypothetical protein